MTRREQCDFIRELCNRIRNEAIQHTSRSKIPAGWDGHELRVYLAGKFQESASMSLIHKEPKSKRARDFRNVVLVENL